jgi:surface protein
MFRSAESFNQPLNNWDTSSVIEMEHMFNDSKMSGLPTWFKYHY